ncbi:MAG: NADH-quinone oxidoreductase subunit N [Planctomycetes bacterium]|nr:NADH-quinone oxidoreductase subunit N [Planctomycetota bacterium]
MGNLESLSRFAPELALCGTLAFVLLLDLFLKGRERPLAWLPTAAGISLAIALALRTGPGGVPLFGGMIVDDALGFFFKMIFLMSALGVVLYARDSRDIAPSYTGEFHVFTLAVTLGLFWMATARDIVMVYLAVEIVSITSYVLAGFVRKDVRSGEAALKYVIYGGVASGVMIFGIAILYGLTGSTDLATIGERLASPSLSGEGALGEGRGFLIDAAPILSAYVLVLAGIAFKMAVAPFHMWCPDVYEGAPTAVTAFLSVGPKAAGFALLMRFLMNVALVPSAEGWVARGEATDLSALLALLSVLTMTIGNLSAIRQTNLKRLLAFSSIAHAGYLLMGCVIATRASFEAMLFYFAVYVVMNLGAFFTIILLARRIGSEDLPQYAGAGWRSPVLGSALVVFLVSLTGLPPTGGFMAKFWLFSSLIRFEGGAWTWLVMVALVNSVISLFYYFSIVRVIFLQRPAEGAGPIRAGWLAQAGLGGMAALLVVLQVRWQPVMEWAQGALK